MWFALDRGSADEHDLGDEVAQRGCGESSSSTFTRGTSPAKRVADAKRRGLGGDGFCRPRGTAAVLRPGEP